MFACLFCHTKGCGSFYKKQLYDGTGHVFLPLDPYCEFEVDVCNDMNTDIDIASTGLGCNARALEVARYLAKLVL